MSEEANETPQKEAPAQDDRITIADFQKIEFKVARVIEASEIEGADRLLKLRITLGTEERQLVAGIKSAYAPEDLVGRNIVVVANLKPAKLRGVESQGMMLAVKGADRVWPLSVEGDVAPGTRVT